MAWNNSKKGKNKKNKETLIKKALKKIFGKNFIYAMILLVLLGIATWLLYLQVPVVKDFIDGDDIMCDDLGRWSGIPKRILVHGLSKIQYDTHKMITE